MHLALVTITVRDYDEAIAFYTLALGFDLLEDTALGNGKRWVRVRPRGSDGAACLLSRATTPEQIASIGNQTGGRVGFFLHTDDLARDHSVLLSRGVKFVRPPIEHPYGRVAVFADLYGNLFDLIQPREANRADAARSPTPRTTPP